MKNKYDEIRQKNQKTVNEFPLMFAFSEKQFNESMEKHGLKPTETDKIVSIGGGGFIKLDDLDAYNKMWDEIREEHNNFIESDKIGDGYIKDMFVSELENHEYGYTYELDDTLAALELTYDQVLNSPNLKLGLELAIKKVLGKEKQDEYEL